MTRQNSWNFDTTYTVGDVLYADTTSTLTKLSPGSDGEVLTLASGVPTWAASGGGGGGSWTLLSTFTAASDTSHAFTSLITTTYKEYYAFIDIVASANNQNMILEYSQDNGSSYVATNIYQMSFPKVVGGSSLISNSGPSASPGHFLDLWMWGLASTMTLSVESPGTRWGSTSVNNVNALRFRVLTGNMTSGTIKLYGR